MRGAPRQSPVDYCMPVRHFVIVRPTDLEQQTKLFLCHHSQVSHFSLFRRGSLPHDGSKFVTEDKDRELCCDLQFVGVE